jgi:hypothetical protein
MSVSLLFDDPLWKHKNKIYALVETVKRGRGIEG